MSTDTLVKPYQQLRQETLARDRGLREKVMSLEEAAKLVRGRRPRRHRRLHHVAHAASP